MSALRRRHVCPRFGPASLVAVGLLSAVVVLAPQARAQAEHPIVTRALGLVDEADFPGALAAFTEAEARSDLSREDLATMYAHRALVLFAQRDEAAMRADLRRWLVLAPGASLPAAAPPPVVSAAEELRAGGVGPLRLAVARSFGDGSIRVTANVLRDDAGLVREVRVFASIAEAPWTAESGGELVLPIRGGQQVRYGAEAIGPGGAVLATAGSRASPRTAVAPSAPAVAAPDRRHTRRSARADDAGFPWWIVGAGAGAAVAIGVLVTVVAVSPSGDDRTPVGGPTWSF